MSGVVLIFVAIFLGIVLAKTNPETVGQMYRWIKGGRRIFFSLLALAFAIWFVMSGVLGLMILGFLTLIYATLVVVYEKPHEEIKAWIT